MYRIFISHSHQPQHTAAYNSLVKRLDEHLNGGWYNCSVPRNKRYGADNRAISDDEMRRILTFHIAASHVLVIASDPVVSQSDWLPWELAYAKQLSKPVVGFWSPRVGGERSKLVDGLSDYMVDTGRIDTLYKTIERAVQAHPTTLGPPPEFVPPPAPVTIDVARGAEGSIFYRPTAPPPFDAAPPSIPRLPTVATTLVADVLADTRSAAQPVMSPAPKEVVAATLNRSIQQANRPAGTAANEFVGDDPPTRTAEPPKQALAPDRLRPGFWQRLTGMFGRDADRH